MFGRYGANLRALTGVGQNVLRSVWANQYGRNALIGAGLGGFGGAFSNTDSVLGGMFKGAALFAGGTALNNVGSAFAKIYNARRAAGVGVGKSMHYAFMKMANRSKRYIGSTYNRAVNAFPGIFGF